MMDEARSSCYSASVPAGSGRLKSYPVLVPTQAVSVTSITGSGSPSTSGGGVPSFVAPARRSLSISVGDVRASDDCPESPIATHHQQFRPPPMVIRSHRSSLNTSSITLHPGKPRPRGAAPPPKRSLWQLTRNSMIQFGLEFCYATETAMVTPILLQLGLPTRLYGIAFFLAPIFGFLMNPFIGSTSDRCMCSWGRRRPFILALGIGTLVGVSLYLNGGDIGALIESGDSEDNLWGIVVTLLGVIILDISADSSDGPSRAYLIDVCDLEDVNTGLNLRAVLGGIGGGLGYIANGIDWSSTWFVTVFGSQLRVVFLFNVVIYATCLVMNLTSIRETSLKPAKDSSGGGGGNVKVVAINDANENSDVFSESSPLISSPKRTSRNYSQSIRTSSRAGSRRSNFDSQSSDLPRIGEENRLNASEYQVSEIDTEDDDEEPASMVTLLKSILHMPSELRRLCLNHFFGWAGMVTVLLFFTDFVGQTVYHGDPTAEEGSHAYEEYHLGVKMGCWGMAVFAFSSSLSAIFYMKVDTILSQRTLHVFGQLCFAVGTGLMAVLTHYAYAILALCFVFGVQFTTLMTVPFNILANFHDCDSYKNPKGGTRRGLGTDVACLCCQLFLAQIIVSAIMGPLVTAIGSHVTVVVFASIMGFMASMSSALIVIYKPIGETKRKSDSTREQSASAENRKGVDV